MIYNYYMKQEIWKIAQKSRFKAKKEEKWADFAMPEIEIDFPKDEKFGDYTTNIAMVLAQELEKKSDGNCW